MRKAISLKVKEYDIRRNRGFLSSGLAFLFKLITANSRSKVSGAKGLKPRREVENSLY